MITKFKIFEESINGSGSYYILYYNRVNAKTNKEGKCLSLCYAYPEEKGFKLLFMDYISEIEQDDFKYNIFLETTLSLRKYLYESNIDILYQTDSEKDTKNTFKKLKEEYTINWEAEKYNI